MKALLVLAMILTTITLWAEVVPGVTGQRIIAHNGRKVQLLTNLKGLSLYTFDPDGANESNCYDSCAKTWPPILITQDQSTRLEGDFHFAKRKDGTFQLTFDSRPLYLYIGDKKDGDMKGDGLGGVWHVAIDQNFN